MSTDTHISIPVSREWVIDFVRARATADDEMRLLLLQMLVDIINKNPPHASNIPFIVQEISLLLNTITASHAQTQPQTQPQTLPQTQVQKQHVSSPENSSTSNPFHKGTKPLKMSRLDTVRAP